MYKVFKRGFDFCSALLLFIAISPIFLILAIMVRVNLGKPVFFTQTRSGKGMKPFKLMKFRTMSTATDAEGNLLPDDQRVTKLGRFLRTTSVDELPELFNIIKGDMSVIGPRPLHPRYDEYYTEKELARFKVRGGLITPDSVDVSPIIPWDKQFEYEADYANHLSLKRDCKIFFSVFKILFRRGETDYGGYIRQPFDVERKVKRNEPK